MELAWVLTRPQMKNDYDWTHIIDGVRPAYANLLISHGVPQRDVEIVDCFLDTLKDILIPNSDSFFGSFFQLFNKYVTDLEIKYDMGHECLFFNVKNTVNDYTRISSTGQDRYISNTYALEKLKRLYISRQMRHISYRAYFEELLTDLKNRMDICWNTSPASFMSTRSPFFRENEHVFKDILEGNAMMKEITKCAKKEESDKKIVFQKVDLRWDTLHNTWLEEIVKYNKKEEASMLGIQVLFTKIQKVIYNNPATIVFWNDGTKTVVKCCKDDTYDPEKGLLMAIVKKSFRDSNDFHKELKRWSIHTNPQLWSYRNNCMVTICESEERGEK